MDPVKKPKIEIDTSIPPLGKYGLLMGRNRYIKLDQGVQVLIKSKRHFVLYKWSKDPLEYKNLYAYIPWVAFAGGKFTIISKHHKWCSRDTAMKPMHIWFKDDLALKEWLGDEMFSLLVADLM